MENKELLEKLADLEHQQWQHWTQYFLGHATHEGNIERWQKQAFIDYKDLSEEDKEKDRKWARKVLEIFENHAEIILATANAKRGL